MHRVQAVQPDPGAGWHRARATGGGFTVLLPGPFNDFTMTAPAKDGAIISTHSVGTQMPGGIKYAATAMSRGDGKKLDRAALESLARSFRPRSRFEREIALGDHPGIEVGLPQGRLRAYVVEDTVYQLVVEFPGTPARDLEVRIETFFNSFQPR